MPLPSHVTTYSHDRLLNMGGWYAMTCRLCKIKRYFHIGIFPKYKIRGVPFYYVVLLTAS